MKLKLTLWAGLIVLIAEAVFLQYRFNSLVAYTCGVGIGVVAYSLLQIYTADDPD